MVGYMMHLSRLLLLIAPCLIRVAFAQDLILDTEDGFLVSSSNPMFANTLANQPPKPANPLNTQSMKQLPSLAVYNRNGDQLSDACPLSKDWTVQLLNANTNPSTIYASVTVNGDYTVTVNAASGSFTPSDGLYGPPDPYDSYGLISYNPGTYLTFNVADGSGAPQCTSGNPSPVSFSGQSTILLRISTLNTAKKGSLIIMGFPGGSSDPPIPISGHSLQFVAPKNLKFSCDGQNPVTTATLGGLSSPLGLVVQSKFPKPAEALVLLDGISDWRITAYPQQLEITPGWRGAYKFRAPAPVLNCSKDGGSLSVVFGDGDKKPDLKPQQFVIDWSPGWFRTRRWLTVPCGVARFSGNCRMALITKGQ